jgi:hypothetical protein
MRKGKGRRSSEGGRTNLKGGNGEGGREEGD